MITSPWQTGAERQGSGAAESGSADGVERRRRTPLQHRFPPRPPHTGRARFHASGVPTIRLRIAVPLRQPIAVRSSIHCSFWCLGPFALYWLFSSPLGGRNTTDYYGPAAPGATLATCPPTHAGVPTGSGVARRAISPSTIGALPLPLRLACQAGKLTSSTRGLRGPRMPPHWTHAGQERPSACVLLRFRHPIRHSIGRGRWALPQIAPRRVVPYFRHGYSGLPVTGSP
jgi:hypothetical protein